MELRIVGDYFPDRFFEEIGAITNYGILFINRIKYDEDNKILFLPIERCRIKDIKKFVFVAINLYRYDKNDKIPALITIKNIIDFKIENNCNDPNFSQINMLFGISIKSKGKQNEIYISSAEEDRGNTCYSLSINVSEINIDICDQ